MKNFIAYSLFLISNYLSANRKIIKSVFALSLLWFCSVSFAVTDDVIIDTIRKGNVAAVDALMQNGDLKVNQTLHIEEADLPFWHRTYSSYTPLMVAAKSGLINIVEYFIHNEAETDQQINGMTALLHAAAWGHKDVVIFLLRQDANVHLKDSGDFTALMHAILGINKQPVTLLYQYLSLYAPDSTNFDLLIKSVLICDVETIKRLMANETNAEVQSIISSLLLAKADKMQIIKVLISSGVDINAKNKNNFTALIFAAMAQNAEAVSFLLENNADVNIQNADGDTALICAAKDQAEEITQLLLASKADTDIQNKQGNTALICAVQNQRTETVKLLFASKARINIKNNDGYTALAFAASIKNAEIIQLLVEYGTGVKIQNLSSNTPRIPVKTSPEGCNVARPLSHHYNDSDISRSLRSPSQDDLKYAIEHYQQDAIAHVNLIQYIQHLKIHAEKD